MSIRTKSYRDMIEDRRIAALDLAIGFWSYREETPLDVAVLRTASAYLRFMETGRSPLENGSATIHTMPQKGKPA